jgi:hypothetical protein
MGWTKSERILGKEEFWWNNGHSGSFRREVELKGDS